LLAENRSLREKNEILKARLGIIDPPRSEPPQDPENHLPLAFAALESQMLPFLAAALDRKVKVVVVTRQAADFKENLPYSAL
jgi:hypothetical protein